jgi:hypothetical protein
MATQRANTIIHIDESLEKWQRDVLDEHLRLQAGVIASKHNDDRPHLLFIENNPERTDPESFIRMVERHGYHAERIG